MAAVQAILLQSIFDTQLSKDLEKFADGMEQPNEHVAQSRLKELEEELLVAKERHEKIVTGKPSEQSKKYSEDNIFSNIREKYHELWGKLHANIPKVTPDFMNCTLNGPQCKSSELKLAKMSLPIFTGKYKEWMAFNNLFTSTVHNNTSMDPIIKLQRLKGVLAGEAELIVRNLTLNDENYPVARALLMNRYQHTRRLVNSYLKELYDLPMIKTETSKSLKSLLNILNDSTSALKQLKLDIEDYQLVYHMSRKLPQSFLTAFEQSLGKSTELPTFEEFQSFLETRFRMLEMIEPSEGSHKSFHVASTSNNNKDKRSQSFNQKRDRVNSCLLCNGPHKLDKCERFKNMQQQTRFETVKNNRACINCLDTSHNTRSCRSRQRCRVCKKSHHLLLHRYDLVPDVNNVPINPVGNNSTVPAIPPHANNFPPNRQNYHITSEGKATLLGTAQVRAFSPFGMSTVIRALVDPCSEDNYILDSTVQQLNLKKYYSPSTIGVLGDDNVSECTHRVNLQFNSLDDLFSLEISAGVVENITSNLPSIQLPINAFGYFNSLPLADGSFHVPGAIHVLLGVNVHTKIMLSKINRLGENLIAEQTRLGYLIRGQATTNTEQTSSLVLMTQTSSTNLNNLIKRFWEIEEVNVSPPLHPDDALCEEIFKKSIKVNPDGHLTMDLPFRGGEDPLIGPSRYLAVKRLLSIEKKLNSNAELREEYHKTIMNYLESNHLSKSLTSSNGGYYMPHHAVVKESSSTTKVRVVFDASCRSLDRTSLNDHLLTGQKLQRDIREIVFNWRQYPFALTADIEKMYRMFLINPRHHEYQKIVWRFNESEPIQDYTLRTATFGTSCAPFLAIRSLHYIADLHQSTHPSASFAIKNEFYVDDFMSGGFSIAETLQKQHEVRTILKKYNLTLRKWSSNNKTTLSDIPTDLLELSKDLSFDETEFRKTLGIFWSQKKDSFFFSITLPNNLDGKFTKRQILSLIARLYDPLGWVSPCTMFAKQIMQKVWQTKAAWDEVINDEICKSFTEFLTQLPLLTNFSVPRWTNITDSESPLTVFGFSDASDKGYSAVVYLVDPKSPVDNPSLILLTSKTKLADLKYQSTARLELNGALLLADLLKWTVQLYKPRPVHINAFCDSKIVLAWLQGHPSRWKTYIANRTSQILEWMQPNQWNYVDTKINPADCASRGLLPTDLLSHHLWINGPNVNQLKIGQIPPLESEHQQTFDESVKKSSIVLHSRKTNNFNLLNRFSNHSKLVRVMTNVVQFSIQILLNLARKQQNEDPSMKPKCERFSKMLKHLEIPEYVIFRMLQHEFYKEEVKELTLSKELRTDSKLRGLSPFLDAYGVLRVGGRLHNADLNYDQRHPIILPPKHQVVTNLIADAHEVTIHGTESLTQSYLRNRFHIPRVSEKVRHFIHGCMKCFKLARYHQEILMGSLPVDRANFSRPFQHSGVDYAGPITTKAYPGRCKKFLKSYIALFICLCTKAIHIELVSDLSSQAFLAAFKRFSGRRGRCHRLYSDNGTNFVGANKTLQSDIRLAEHTWNKDLEQDFKQFGTEWKFIPPASPHFGGLWEAGVKSTKNHLKKTIGSSILTFEEMSTLLVQIEAALNSRPLCPLTNDPNEYSFLTPGHFLVGGPLIAPPEKRYDMDSKRPLQRWEHIQATYQRFVRLWKHDYLQRLQNRPKGQLTTVHYKQGDLVLLADDDTPPTLWPMVIIEATHPGHDGIVRVVTVRTPMGKIYKRPVSKLRYLPCNYPLEN